MGIAAQALCETQQLRPKKEQHPRLRLQEAYFECGQQCHCAPDKPIAEQCAQSKRAPAERFPQVSSSAPGDVAYWKEAVGWRLDLHLIDLHNRTVSPSPL